MPDEEPRQRRSRATAEVFDPDPWLDRIDRAIAKKDPTPTSGGRPWLATVIVVGLVILGVGIWGLLSWRQKKELARLRHEKNKTKILAEKAQVDAELSQAKEQIEEAGEELKQLEERIQYIDAEILAGEARYAANLRTIDSIQSWRDAGVR